MSAISSINSYSTPIPSVPVDLFPLLTGIIFALSIIPGVLVDCRMTTVGGIGLVLMPITALESCIVRGVVTAKRTMSMGQLKLSHGRENSQRRRWKTWH